MDNYAYGCLCRRREYYAQAAMTELRRAADEVESHSYLVRVINQLRQQLSDDSTSAGLGAAPVLIGTTGAVLEKIGSNLAIINRVLEEIDGALDMLAPEQERDDNANI